MSMPPLSQHTKASLDRFLLQINFVKPFKNTPVTCKRTLRSTCPPCSWVCPTESSDLLFVSEFTAHRRDFLSKHASSLAVASMLSQTMIPSKYHKSESLVFGIINSIRSFSSYCPKIMVLFLELEDDCQPLEWIGATFAPAQDNVEWALLEMARTQKFRVELQSQLPSTVGRKKLVDVVPAFVFSIEEGCSDASDKTKGSCTICLSELFHGEVVAYFPCSHIFHNTCIRQWLTMGQICCPLCRFEVRMGAILFV